jgi:hypothetical protein
LFGTAGAVAGVLADIEAGVGDAEAFSLNCTNVQVNDFTNGTAFTTDSGIAGTWQYINSYNNGGDFNPSGTTSVSHSSTINPLMGNSYLWVPDNSPMKGAGLNGADIGCDILYQYIDGLLTTSFWRRRTYAHAGEHFLQSSW